MVKKDLFRLSYDDDDKRKEFRYLFNDRERIAQAIGFADGVIIGLLLGIIITAGLFYFFIHVIL